MSRAEATTVPMRARRTGASARSRRLGFTLIEIMAVVAIMAMVFAIGAPRLGGARSRILENEAEAIAASLEFARQRAIMTGKPHRLLIDLEQGGYQVEWLVSEESGNGGGPSLFGFDTPPPPDASSDTLELHPPARPPLDFRPIPNRELGSMSWIPDSVYFVGLESPAGWVEGGDVSIIFEADGTTEYALLEIADADDRHLTLEIEPLLERVRRREGPARS